MCKLGIDAHRVNEEALDGTSMFQNVRTKVFGKAPQTPEFANVRKAGHYGGDFIFVPRQ